MTLKSISPADAREVAARLDSLSPAKRALLDALLARQGAQAAPAIPRRQDDGPAPLSYPQEWFWSMEQLAPDSSLHNRPCSVRMTGPLEPALLEQAWNEVLRRHEALRTTFPYLDGQPMQVVAPAAACALPVIDLGALPPEAREARCRQFLLAQIHEPFDLARGPLWRAALLRLSPTEHVLALTVHHILFDGWSMGILLRELAAHYGAFATGAPSPLPAPPARYVDYACWQRHVLHEERLDALLDYWQTRLSGQLPGLELPTDGPRSQERSERGDQQAIRIPVHLVAALKAVGAREGATLFMTLLAAFASVLMRYSRQEELIVGTPTAGRNQMELEGLIGNFVNMLVLRLNLTGNPSFRELLGRVRETAVGAFAHQDLPFVKLMDALQQRNSLHSASLFHVLFQLRNMPSGAPEARGVRFEEHDVNPGVANVDLAVDIVEQHDGLYCVCEYRADLFSAETVGRLLAHYQMLLEGVAADPDERLTRLPLLTPDERRQTLVAWNATACARPNACVHQLIAARAAQCPEAVAVRCFGEEMTYRELDRRANQLARYLRRLGVGPETPVGMCMERSPELATVLLGILKAGGAYVPLDPKYPAERLAFIVDDARVPVILTLERLRGCLPAGAQRVICLDVEWDNVAREPADDPAVPVTPDALMMIIYTSGSTGTPKGVLINHRGVVNHNLAAIDLYGIHPGDRVLQFSSINFDMAVEEIFPTWIAGGTLVLYPMVALSGAAFVRWIEEEGITVLDLSTAYWHEWVQVLSLANLPPPSTVRLVIVGGDRASAAAYAHWRQLASERIRWINTYGPTEATVIATAYDPADDPGFHVGDELPIGRPIANTQIYLLGPDLQPVPVGVPGELCIGGMGLARGYLRRPELTAERFIRHPYSADPEARLYRTGDLARYRLDGNIEFLGRIDEQVKIRGFRIEPGEIVAVIDQHPAVHESVVIAREIGGEKRLIAYVVPRSGEEVTPQQLRAHVAEHLPEYMVPNVFILHTGLPLTHNGKVDRQALPSPDEATVRTRDHEPPRDELERQLAGIWESLLGVAPVGIHDNFFELGGYSLLAIRLFTLIEKVIGTRLPLVTLVEAPTIAGLADVLRQDGWTPRWTSLVPLQVAGTRPPFFAVSPGGISVLFYQKIAQAFGPDQPFYGLQEPLDAKGRVIYDHLEDLAAHYLRDMRAFQPTGPYYLGGYCLGGVIALEIARQLHDLGEEVGLVALIDSYGPKKPNRFRLKFRLLHFTQMEGPDPLRVRLQRGMVSLSHWALATARDAVFTLAYRAHLLPAWLLQKINRRGFYRLVDRQYRPRVYPGPVTLFRTECDPFFPRDPLFWWDGTVHGNIAVQDIAGRHDNFINEPYVFDVAEKLRQAVVQAQAARRQEPRR